MRAWIVGLSFLALAGCSTPTAPEPVATPSPVAPPAPPSPPPVADSCGANQHQGLVGLPRSEIPVPVRPEQQRVACTTCPVTMDHRPDRLNFFFDAQTGLIREVRCG